MTIDEKIKLFLGMIRCEYPVSLYEFDRDFSLVRYDADETQAEFIKKYFYQSGSFKRLKKQALLTNEPMLLATEIFGIEMGVVIYSRENVWRLFIIGPVFSAESSSYDADYILLQYVKDGKKVDNVSLVFRKKMLDAMKSFPVISPSQFSSIVCMLNYCINGETITSLRLLQNSDQEGKSKTVTHKNRQRTYQTEQALLSMVRNGDMNYRTVVKKAVGLSTGVRMNANEPLRQAKISVETFITLCVRAAIEGSLSPELAYSCGDSYIQEVENAQDVGTIMNISQTMYEDFIKRVHQQRLNPEISNEIQNIMNYIEVHTGDDIKISQLAKIAGYTEYYLSRKFKTETRYSINDYIAITRVERAKVLLATTDFSISTIADDLQFCTSSYFTAVFHKFTEMTPAEYRQKNK